MGIFNNKQRPELLAPVGNIKCLITAINAGADAVYFGLQDFNMRARAQNFKLSDLAKIRKLCNKKKVKMYLTLNTIIYDNEIAKVERFIKKVKPYIDAIICSDLSVMFLCKKHNLPFHISTQCSISNSSAARFYKNLGAERAVLARELSIKQIKQISKIIPVEIFVHGAMCVSISGRCFMSQFMFGQSANRGKCIQPCRRPYQIKDNQGQELRLGNNYILSPKDLCTLPFIEKLKQSGAVSFKIEGRNKEPEYVDTVVRVYRNALDNKLTKNQIKESINELKKVYNKGFSSGFYFRSPTADDFSKVENSDATQTKRFIGKITKYFPKISVGQLKLNAGSLKIGDEILITGKETALIRHKIKSMEIKNKSIESVKKGQEVGIQLPKCKKGDELYKVLKK